MDIVTGAKLLWVPKFRKNIGKRETAAGALHSDPGCFLFVFPKSKNIALGDSSLGSKWNEHHAGFIINPGNG